MNNTPPPGWYPDNGGRGQRYWDGQKWTEHIAPASMQALAGQSPSVGARTPRDETGPPRGEWLLRHKVLSGVLALVILSIPVVAVAVSTAREDRATSATPSRTMADPSAQPSPISVPADDPEPVDADGDGVADDADFRPHDPRVQTPEDVDSDKDGASDGVDLRPRDPRIQTRDDIDTDGDAVPDYQDDFPKNAEYSKDSDGDSVPNQLDDFPKDPRYSQDADGDGAADSKDAFPSDPSRWKVTMAMANALAAAQDYLDYSAFSRQALIDQLSSKYGSNFRVDDATWAVGQLDVDWKQQAVRSAKDYLEYSPFSRQGLIDQLSSPYGAQFTVEEATYAADKVGL